MAVGDVPGPHQHLAAKVKATGGQVLMGPRDVPNGHRIVQGTDPQGAMFAVVGKKTA